tara:strand:- start:1041 stop:1985 length:945 start_codon:yes stop_codon:yes gene_type:complete
MIIPYLTQHDSPHLSKTNSGLGNALFQIFSSYGLSRTYNHELNLSNLLKLLVKLKKWNLNHDKTIYRNLKSFFIAAPTNNLINLRENYYLYSLYDTNLVSTLSLHKNYVITLVGYLQSHMYFDKYYDEICDLLKPDENSLEIIKNKYSHLFDKEVINITSHFRVNWGCNIKYDTEFIYFFDALNFIIEKCEDKDICINIFSDDITTIKKNNKLIHDKLESLYSKNIKIVYFENNVDYIDLWCMTLCHHNILSNSTLSWWGAYLNKNSNKIVTYPDDILRLVVGTIYPEKQLIERREQHYKKEWVPIATENVISQ